MTKQILFPILRGRNCSFYEFTDTGLYRVGKKFLKEKKLILKKDLFYLTYFIKQNMECSSKYTSY